MDKKNLKKIAILNVLKEQAKPVSSARITQLLNASGYDFSERTVRFYLKELDRDGLTVSCGRKGRNITEQGLSEFHSSQIMHRTGYLSARIDQMMYRMDFDLPRRSGKVVVNTSVADPQMLLGYADEICQVFDKGYAMGKLLTLLSPGETIGETVIPDGKVGFCTVCSITVNGVLLKHGVPVSSRFGGLLELVGGKATRFVEMIHYDGTSIDPLEVFIRSGMTDYHGAIRDGNGQIGGSFRDIPADSRELVSHISERLDSIGLGAIMELGLPGQPLLDIPVNYGQIGAIVVGGLNPIAILEEQECRVVSRALNGLMDYSRLFYFDEFPLRLKKIIAES
ncbi:MAG TPA: NrpR regulatory domain-containing protein [Phycisphaerae bacterium]|nr:NrpR regulatory domain-containing protein [Phycisphaerae bacterium]HPS53656.1 NrpR regulatory domain-containing protein [Phycisphaerae bacterium]